MGNATCNCRDGKDEAKTEDPDAAVYAQPTQVDESRGVFEHEPIAVPNENRWESDDMTQNDQFASLPEPEQDKDDIEVVPVAKAQEPIWEEAPAQNVQNQEQPKKEPVATKQVPKAAPESAPVLSVPPKQEPQKEKEDSGPEPKLYGYPGKKLQVYLETGFTDMGDYELNQISNNLKNGLAKGTIQSRGAIYVIDLSDMNNASQVNPATKKGRRLRLVNENHPQGEKIPNGEIILNENGEPSSMAGQGKQGTKKKWKLFGR